MKLKAKFNKGRYKSTDAWLDAIYRNNKDKIDSRIETTSKIKSKKAVFKKLITERMDEGMTPTKAVESLGNSTIFTDVRDRLTSNALKAIKRDKDAYNEFREMTKEKGRYTKIDLSKFKYDKDDHSYSYGDIVISFKNSPYGIVITRVE